VYPIPIESVIRPLAPRSPAWRCFGDVSTQLGLGYPAFLYEHSLARLRVISAVEVAIDKDGHSNGPEYHLSVSRFGRRRCSSSEARMALTAFAMDGAEEDNHVPSGKVRNYWRPVNENLIGRECECKATENAIREDGGDYVWRT